MLNINESLYLITGAFDLFPDAIIVVDAEGIIRNSNKQIEAVMGYTEDEIKNQPLNILLPERFRHNHYNFVASFFNTTGIRKMGEGISLYGKHKSGKEINIDIALSIIDTGKSKYALAVIRDISDKIKLAHQVNQIENIKNELERFAYVLTHDLKAPLHKVRALTQLIHLELSEKESEDIKTTVNYLNESVLGMENLIQGVLDYYKAKLNKNVVEEMVDLNLIFDQTMNMIEVPNTFTVKKIQSLPVIKGNPTMMLQVFMNLIYNAISHSTKENGLLEIDYSVENNLFEFSFSDNGTPIPNEKKSSIFEITTQLGFSQNKNSHGLGLSIVKQIVENNSKNKIWCEDSPLAGCCFKFTWPVLTP
jgi:PAS domain S-box-containing protein